MVRSSIVALVGLLAMGTLGRAQLVSTVYVPDASTTSGAADTVLFTTAQGRVMFNYIRGEVGPDSVMKKITELSFVPTVTGTFSATRLQVRLGRGFKLTLDPCYTNNVECPTIVYDGPFTWNAVKDTWNAIPLQTSYVTDGKSNVVVDIRWMGGTGNVPVRTESSPLIIGSRTYDITSADPWNGICGVVAPHNTVPRARLSIDNANALLASDHNHIGATRPHSLHNCTPAARYQIASALGQDGILDFGGGHRLRINFDPLMWLSVFFPPPTIFTAYAGVLDAQGNAIGMSWSVPNDPNLIGFCIVHGAVVLDAGTGAVIAATNTMASVIEP